MKKISVILLLITVLGCATSKTRVRKNLGSILHSSFYNHQFTGVLVVDAETGDTLYRKNSNRYFTPASNTKIFTLYTALKALPERVPALTYTIKNDTVFFQGTGDPSFLHPYLKDSTAFNFLKKQNHLAWYANNFYDAKFGPGWSWDDYEWYYSPERSALPLYGNVTTIISNPEYKVWPDYFKDSVVFLNYRHQREMTKNRFYFDSDTRDTLEIPFIANINTEKGILEHTLSKTITMVSQMPLGPRQTLPGIPADSLYTRMMLESDNFLAEQLLLLSAGQWTDTLSTTSAIAKVLKDHLKGIAQEPRWVDGSGLSRYNLFTPESMVYVLQQLYRELPRKRLFSFFPVGGISGTLKNWYGGTNTPYIYAKSGTLSNNHNLSGYLLTKSGKTLIFSFMNNHYRHPTSEVKKKMQLIFEFLRDTY